MFDVNLSTQLKDLRYVMGSFEPPVAPSEDALSSLRYLLTDCSDIRKKYISLGFHLLEFDHFRYYLDFGYSSIFDFAEQNLNMDKSAVSRCMAVCENFTAQENTRISLYLNDKYEGYSYGQLCEMLSMSEDLRKRVHPDMTIREIREIKKNKGKMDSETVKDEPPEECFTSCDVATEKKVFDYEKYASLSGAARNTYFKSREEIDMVALYIVDASGKPVGHCFNCWCDLLEWSKSNSRIVIRLEEKINEIG